jgi:hypothetical protein
MKATILTLVILVVVITSVSGEEKKNKFEFELDPLAYLIGGGSGHLAYTWKNERIQLGYGQLILPDGMRNNQEVSESFKAIALKWDYFFFNDDPIQGFFAGPTFDYLFLDYKDEKGNQFNDTQFNIGIRAGYKFDLFKSNKYLSGLYLTPWAGASWLTNPGDYI